MIQLEGCLNFRDLGVYRTRQGLPLRKGVFFRSDGLHHMTRADVRVVRDELGVRDVVDLRSTAEVDADGRATLAAQPVRYHHLPIYDGERVAQQPITEIPQDLGHRYFLMLRFARKRIVEILEVLATTEDPAVFHCAAGKDRTGVIAALILDIADVDDAQIVTDYTATAANMDRIEARLRESDGYKHILQDLPSDTLHADASTMSQLLERVEREWGSLQEFALSAGLRPESAERLRSRLVG